MRGRPRSFDIDLVVDEAMRLFWTHGFEGTNLDDVTAVTGVNVSSLYAAFGNKRGLFQAALARYEHHVGAALAALEDGTKGLRDAIVFLEWIHAWVTSGEVPNGCLIVNTMAEFNGTDPEIAAVATRYRERVRVSLKAALMRAERAGEIAPRSGASRTMLVQAGLFGALVTARGGAGDEAGQMVKGLIAEVKRWSMP